MTGVIKRLDSNKGFGFIRTAEGVDYFFHRSEVVSGVNFDTLREGARVSFDEQHSAKGPRAINVNVG